MLRRVPVRCLVCVLAFVLVKFPTCLQAEKDQKILACLYWNSKPGDARTKTASYYRGSTCKEAEESCKGAGKEVVSCTDFHAIAPHSTTYADASVLLSSGIRTSGNVIGLSAIGSGGTQPPVYVLVLNVAGADSFIHVIRRGTSGFIEIADVAAPSITAGNDQLLSIGAVKAGEVPFFGFQETNILDQPSVSDFTVSYATLGTNGVLVTGERIQVDVSALTFAPLSPAVEIRSLQVENGLPHVRFLSVANWSYQLVYKNDLNTGTWNGVVGAMNVIGTGGVLDLIDPGAVLMNPPRRFYQVLVSP